MSGFTFGNTQPQPTSLFSNTSTNPKPNFGGFTTPNPQKQSNQSTFLFGSAPAAPSTSLFGSTNQQQTGQLPTSNLFGSTNQQQETGQTGGLFGSTNQNSAQRGGLFGSTTQPAQGSSLFGQAGQNGQTGQTGAGLGSSLFTNVGGSSLFGQKSQQQQPQQQQSGLGGSLFGSTSQQPQQQVQPQNSLIPGFGQQSTPSQLQPQQNGLFASTSQQGNLFGSTTGNPSMNESINVNGYGQQAKQEPDIQARMLSVRSAWDQNSPDCRFKYFFYNVVDPGTTAQYGRPAGANDEIKWLKSLRENLDPTSMVPVLATGWQDVRKRISLQEHTAGVHQARMQEITHALSHLSRQTSLSSSIRLAALQNQLAQLMRRLIHLAATTPQFIPILQSTAFRTEEAEVKGQLEGIKSELDGKVKSNKSAVGFGTPKRGGQGRMMGQVNELWGQVEEIRRRRRGRGGDSREGWLGDEKALGEVAEILATQQLALQKLTDLLNNALFDVNVIRQGMGMITSERS